MIKKNCNVIVYVKFKVEGDSIYECVGVLMENNLVHVRIAFNAFNDIVKDDIIIQKKQIIEFYNLEEQEIETFTIQK